MYVSPGGKLGFLAKAFMEDFPCIDTETPAQILSLQEDTFRDIEQALVLGIRDYLQKCGFSRVHLGLPWAKKM
jgi:NAD+ synthase (glutamine-hydrolysing)